MPDLISENSPDESRAIKVMVVDDHPALRAGLRTLIDATPALRVVLDVDSGEAAYAAYGTTQPDVVVMDLSMEGFGGIEAINRIRRIDPRAAILVFSVHDSAVLLDRALAAGAMGFVTKGNDVGTLLQGIQSIAEGKNFISPDMVSILLEQRHVSAEQPLKGLTPREFEVFQLLCAGNSLSKSAQILNLSRKTVSNHFTQIRNKLGLSTTAEMMRLAIRQGLVEI